MSAQPRQATNSEIWTRWEGQVVKGIFPLRRFLGGSDQGAVFLSEYNTGKSVDVAVKIVPAAGAQAETRLAHWRTAASLSHPHLVRLFDMGRCQLGGREYLFIVMEHGEQTMAQFLAQRALTAEEARTLLVPTLDALAFLHGSQMVHAQLKPSNFLVVNDTLKLTSDAIRPVGYRGLTTADDVCGLGMTLLEAFTRRTPVSPDGQDEVSSLLANVPAQYANALRRCLHPNPASRPTVAELQAQHESARPSESSSEEGPHAHPLLLAIPALLLFGLAVWIAQHPSGGARTVMQPPAAQTSPPEPAKPRAKPTPSSTPKPSSASSTTVGARPSNPVTVTPPPAATTPPSEDVAARSSFFTGPPSGGPSDVLVEVIPDPPRAITRKIQDNILVTVRVLVDPTGNVMAVMIEKAGSNRTLTNLADEAARGWKFVPSEKQDTRVWQLTFEFTPYGATVREKAV